MRRTRAMATALRSWVQSPQPGEAVFLSEAASSQPRFRLRYRLEPSGVLQDEFAIAPPGAPDAFKPYLSWESRRVPEAPLDRRVSPGNGGSGQ